ncbi:MAG: extracellular solute-binding protein [Clostridia bacterium]|nr:extracellular solute-binding protein [Clostridia bacterium]MBP3294435.1 extracellular solute-binding protein [Clostridia bacterium]
MKKSLSLLLALLMLLPAVTACGDASSADTPGTGDAASPAASEETVPVETEPELSDDIEPMDFEQYGFTILTSSTTTQHAITAINEQNGDVLNEAMYNRTQQIAEKYNIIFNDDYVPGNSDAALNAFTNSQQAGDQAYDLAMLLERRAFALTNQGYFTDIGSLEYVNLDKPYWFQDVNDTINFTDKTYLSYGSANLGMYDMTHVLCFNQKMITDLQLETPYNLVLEGTWTIDKMKTMGETAMRDVDGDGAWGETDIYGLVGATNALPMNFLAAARQRTIENYEDGTVEIRLLSNPMIEEIFTYVSDMCWQTGFWYTKTTDSNNYWRTESHFQEDRALFADHTFYSTISLRDMVSDFGIVPFPKYSEDQKEYGVMVEAGSRTMTVPANVAKPDLSGAVLETLHFLSYRDVMPAYYEVTLKQKVSRDSVSSQMLDIIMDSICYDLGMTMFNDNIKDGIFTMLFKANLRKYSSAVNGKMKAIEAAIAAAKGE